MRYIRTKDKISVERIYENDIPEPKNEHEKEILQKLRDNIGEVIIKQADTIEELCDEFVFEGDYGPILCNFYEMTDIDAGSNFDELKYWFNYSKEQQYKTRNCYGAVWTDKGLIYVARMNDKGEWELL